MLGNLFMASCLVTLNIILLSIAGAMRLLPSIFTLMRRALHGMLLLSIRTYDYILKQLHPMMKHHLGIDLHIGYWHVPLCILFSLVIGLSILLLLGMTLNGWSVGICTIHGLMVGLMRGDNTNSHGLHLGVNIE